MNTRARSAIKAAVFCGFVLLSITVNASWQLDPPAPSRVGDAPYAVTARQLDIYAQQLEGQTVVLSATATSVSINASSGDVIFAVRDDLFGVSEKVLLQGWAPGGVQPDGLAVRNGTIVVVKGSCRILSEGFVVGTEIHVLLPDNVYLVSISGLVVIGVLLFVFFRLDVKHLKFTAKVRGNAGARQYQGEE